MEYTTPKPAIPTPPPEIIKAAILVARDVATELFDKPARGALLKLEAVHVSTARAIAENEPHVRKAAIARAEGGHVGDNLAEKTAALQAAHAAAQTAPMLRQIAEREHLENLPQFSAPATKLLTAAAAKVAATGNALSEIPLPPELSRWGLKVDLVSMLRARVDMVRQFLDSEAVKLASGQLHISRWWAWKAGIIAIEDDCGLQRLPGAE